MKRRWMILVGAVAAIALVVGVSVFILTQPREKTFELRAREFAFHGLGYSGTTGGPTLIVKVGDIVKITLINEGGIKHDLIVITEHDLNEALEAADHKHPEPVFAGAEIHDLEPGKTMTAVFKAEKPGTYVYACFVEEPELHAKLGMFGKIIVEP